MNGGFEDENICLEYDKNCAPEGWISTSLFADHYFDDELNAATGRHFTGLILARKERPALRNFLRSRLLCGLRKGAQYSLQLSIRSRHPVFDSVGVYFSAQDFLYEKDRIAAARPQLFVRADSLLRITENWQRVSLTYTATGDEAFVNIGDFKRGGHDLGKARPDLNRAHYFFVDDVSLTPLNPAERLCGNTERVREEEYAFNPRHDKLDRLIYVYTKNPPLVEAPAKTTVQRIDTLVMPEVLFATGSYAFNRDAALLLDSFASAVKALRVDSLVVEGHTDNQGSVALNQKLSLQRADAVASHVAKAVGVRPVVRGWASQKPVFQNSSTAGRRLNRRVEIYLYLRE